MTDATFVDLVPSSQLEAGGMVARNVMLSIMRDLHRGSLSLFNAVAHYGIKKKPPFTLMSGYRHIFVETSLSRVDSAGMHMVLSEASKLSGLWGPNLFSYRKGFSPAIMAIVLRRSVYKVLSLWGQTWILDWDETGAFPKLQLGNLDQLLSLAAEADDEQSTLQGVRDAYWMAEGDVDAFYRRQRIYPVTAYGLGRPYSAEDGMLEGDSAAPTVYQTAGAVGTSCTTVEGAVRFSGPHGAVALSEFVFSDDRRLIHHKKHLFEELVEERVRTTKAAGGMVNPTKLELFHVVDTEGELELRQSEANVGVHMTGSLSPPTCIGVPILLGVRPEAWIARTEEMWGRMIGRLGAAHFVPIKNIRVVMAFMVARLDYVSSAFVFGENWLVDLQKLVDKSFCDLHGLSMRTAKLFLYLPLEHGGGGCPWLPI